MGIMPTPVPDFVLFRGRLCEVAAVLLRAALLCCLLLVGCAAVRTVPPVQIALLAPFEGRYRELGYDAYYAARLALADDGTETVTLLAVDDGGTVASAVERARALAHNTAVQLVIVLGSVAADDQTQRAFSDLPVMVVGYWGAGRASDHAFMLTHVDIEARLTIPASASVTDAAQFPAPLVGGDVLGLRQFGRLRTDTAGVTVLSSSALPTAEFRQRYLASDAFAQEPGLHAMLVYDAVRMALAALVPGDRESTTVQLAASAYEGLQGAIHFDADGYWQDAPLYQYRYAANRSLIPVDGVVE